MRGFSQMGHVLEHVSHWLDSSYEQLRGNYLGVKAMTEDTEEAVRVQTGSGTDANANPTVEFPPTLHVPIDSKANQSIVT